MVSDWAASAQGQAGALRSICAAQRRTVRSESQIPALSAINDVADLKSDEPSRVRHEAGARKTTQEEDKERMGCGICCSTC